jgi:ketosteroid isomerase-like protein
MAGSFAALVLPLALLVPAQRHAKEAPFLKLEHEWLVAARHRDREVLERILSDDFVDIAYSGAVRTKANALAAPVAPAGTTQTLDQMKVRVYGDTAIVTGRNTVAARDGTRRAVVRFTDVFVRQRGIWRAVSAQETLER